MSKWQKVFGSDHAYKAEIVKDLLEKQGLKPVLINKRDSAYSNFGQHEVLVTSEETIRALKIVEDEVNFK